MSALLLAARLIVFEKDMASVLGTDVVSVPLVIVAVTSVIASFGAKSDGRDGSGVGAGDRCGVSGAYPGGLAFSFACRFHGACEYLWQIGFFLVAWNHQLRISTSVEIRRICED